jgi:hypothetical protein
MDAEKRLADRRDKIFKMMGEISKKTEDDFTNRFKQKLDEFDRMADNAIKSNDPLNAAMYQCLTDLLYYYMNRGKTPKTKLDQYKTQSDEHRKSLGL